MFIFGEAFKVDGITGNNVQYGKKKWYCILIIFKDNKIVYTSFYSKLFVFFFQDILHRSALDSFLFLCLYLFEDRLFL